MTQKGLTLLEIIISMVILSILAAGAFSMVSYSKRVSVRIHQKAVAVSLLEKKMNELKQIGAKGLDLVTRPITDIPCSESGEPARYCEDFEELGGKMKVSVKAQVQEADGDKDVRVDALWNDPFGAPRRESNVTYMAEK